MYTRNRKMMLSALAVDSIVPNASASGTTEKQQPGPITGTYLLELCDLKAEVGKAEATAMQTMFAAMAASTEKQIKDALRDLPKLAEQAGKNKATYASYAGKFRAMHRATVVTGSTAWANGLGRDAAAQKATAILIEAKVMPNGKPRLDKDQRKEAKADARVKAQYERALILARRAGKSVSDAPAYMEAAQLELDTEWAERTAATVCETLTDQQIACYLQAIEQVQETRVAKQQSPVAKEVEKQRRSAARKAA